MEQQSVTTLSSDAEPLLPAVNLNRGQGLGFKVSLSLNDTGGVRAQPRAAWCCLLTPDLLGAQTVIDRRKLLDLFVKTAFYLGSAVTALISMGSIEESE